MADETQFTYKVLADDNLLYGPVDLPTLCEWVRQGLVVRESWIYRVEADNWHRAYDVPEIQTAAEPEAAIAAGAFGVPEHITPGMLRRIRILGTMTDDQIRELATAMRYREIKQFVPVVKMDMPGNSMFLILGGEARVRRFLNGREKILATLVTGDFFGELAMLDHSPRSAEVITNVDSALLELDGGALKSIAERSPWTAVPFVLAIIRTMARRIRTDNDRWKGVLGYLEVLEVDLSNFFGSLFKAARQNVEAANAYLAVTDEGVAYGPVDLATLKSWVQEGRVGAHNWIHSVAADSWRKAGQIAEILDAVQTATGAERVEVFSGVSTEDLWRMKVLGAMTAEQLERVGGILGLRRAKPLEVIVKQDAPGDSMFLIIEGEVRVRQMIKGTEKTLTVLPAGEFFGELSLLDHSPRSADVVAVKGCTLIEITGESLKKLEEVAPDVTAAFLLAVGKTMARRIRMDNHRWGKLIEYLQGVGVDVSQLFH